MIFPVLTGTEKETTGDSGPSAMSDPINVNEGLSVQQGEQGQVNLHPPRPSSVQQPEHPNYMVHDEDSTPASGATHSIIDSPMAGERYARSSFSVTIEDKMGNLIKISRIEGEGGTGANALVDRPEDLSLQISEESGHVLLT